MPDVLLYARRHGCPWDWNACWQELRQHMDVLESGRAPNPRAWLIYGNPDVTTFLDRLEALLQFLARENPREPGVSVTRQRWSGLLKQARDDGLHRTA